MNGETAAEQRGDYDIGLLKVDQFDHEYRKAIGLPPIQPVDLVNAPPHYQHPSGVETITASEHACFTLGNAIKYVLRAPHKGTEVLDLEKADYYVKRTLALITNTPSTSLWTSSEGKEIAIATLATIRDWEADKWWDTHPLPSFYTHVIEERLPIALEDTRRLHKLASTTSSRP